MLAALACSCGDASPNCRPGGIYSCSGPAACRGRQICAADGQSFQPCDCSRFPDGGR
ncbi:MAG: hypothetical protein QM723_12430 [Myxococcaceae bacterium]